MILDARGELPFAFPFWGWIQGFAAIIVAAASGGRAAAKPCSPGFSSGRFAGRGTYWSSAGPPYSGSAP